MPFKCKVNINDICMIDAKLLFMLSYFCIYAEKNNLPVVITSIMDEVEGRAHKTHIEGRAIDISTKDWPEENIAEVEYEFNLLFEDIAAVSASDGTPRAVVVHDAGKGLHFHLQCIK